MRFEEFAAAHGLVIRHVEYGRWMRCATEDKPRKKNGAYKHLGDVAFVQNHATMPEPAAWFPERPQDIRVDLEKVKRLRREAEDKLSEGRQAAAKKAGWIIHQCKHELHPYLARKGFPEATGLVWQHGADDLLVIPMRVGRDLVGAQIISATGDKRFLSGQRCSGAEYVIDAKGIDIWCEGYATGLSVRACLAAMKLRYKIHVCFSAGNLEAMARAAGTGLVVADNDASGTGEKAAQATGLPYFLPPLGDFNDLHQAQGLFRAGMALRAAMR